jgi:hypothetical protein
MKHHAACCFQMVALRSIDVLPAASISVAGILAHHSRTHHAISLMAFQRNRAGDTIRREDLCVTPLTRDVALSDLVPAADLKGIHLS